MKPTRRSRLTAGRAGVQLRLLSTSADLSEHRHAPGPTEPGWSSRILESCRTLVSLQSRLPQGSAGAGATPLQNQAVDDPRLLFLRKAIPLLTGCFSYQSFGSSR